MFGALGRTISQSRSILATSALPDEMFITLVKEQFPEISFFAEDGEISAEMGAGNVSEFPSSMGVEEKRGWGALFTIRRLFLGQKECFNKLIEDQKPPQYVSLEKQTFDHIHCQLHAEINTAELQDGLMWLTLLNDLGKTKQAQRLHQTAIDPTKARISADQRMYELIKAPELQSHFPGFYSLTADVRALILQVLASDCNLSDLQQLELPITAFESLRKISSPNALLLKFWYTLGDVGGAGAHESKGSQRLHEQTARLFFEGIKQKIVNPLYDNSGEDITALYKNYLLFRSDLLKLGDDNEGLTLARVSGLTRLGAKSYVDDAVASQVLQQAWSMLSSKQQQSVCTLLLSQTPGFSVMWGAAIGMNPQTVLKDQVYAQIDNTTFSEEEKAFLKAGSPVEEAILRNNSMAPAS